METDMQTRPFRQGIMRQGSRLSGGTCSEPSKCSSSSLSLSITSLFSMFLLASSACCRRFSSLRRSVSELVLSKWISGSSTTYSGSESETSKLELLELSFTVSLLLSVVEYEGVGPESFT
ncbi:hypothetical protein NC653_037812 [Populus alba x Populus x berolinensis]|uniref:Uncharacterized protein n=1 Tax=Populus alba x Populus x berolinensis TaxID=444605 RepID=A0AAD6PU40_9ROSI|nr:hypothetical protein NC653_037812 [Populus alba x Populus x berolinensis]